MVIQQYVTNWMNHWCNRMNIIKLERDGVLTLVESFEQYAQMVKDVKAKAEHRLFTNCFMMPDEIQRLISLNRFFSVHTDNGLIFVDDEGSHYYMFFFVDLSKPVHVPQLDRNILAENVHIENRMSAQQKAFEESLIASGFTFAHTYRQVTETPQMPPEKYWKKLEAYNRLLEREGKHICIPSNKQLREFEEIYRSEIDRYVQRRFTRQERRRQRDEGLLHCVADENGQLCAIAVSQVFGGAIAAKEEYKAYGYAPILFFNMYKNYYENMPKEPKAQEEYMRSKSFGWIATTNTNSIRLHHSIGLTETGKAMNQFIMPGREK